MLHKMMKLVPNGFSAPFPLSGALVGESVPAGSSVVAASVVVSFFSVVSGSSSVVGIRVDSGGETVEFISPD